MEAATASINAARSALSVVATSADIAKGIRLLSGGLKVNGNMDAEAVAEAYMYSMEGVKRAVFDKAVRTLLRRGAPEKMSKTFLPSAPELLDYCDQIERDAKAMVVLTERLLALPEMKMPEPMSEENCQAMRQKIAQLAKPRTMEAE
jgi:negative regulator of replication initiation